MTRSPWHLSALILEEYARSQTRPEIMETIPEDPNAVSPSEQSTTASPYLVRSRPSSHNSFSPSMPRRFSNEDHVSFEPFMESTRTSFEGDSRRSSDKHLRAWTHTLPGVVDSPHSSFYGSNVSISSNTPNQHRPDLGSLPSGSRPRIRDFANRIRHRQYGSDDGSSSPRNSLSEEYGRSDDGNAKRSRINRNPRIADLALTPASRSGNRVEGAVRSPLTSERGDAPDVGHDPLLTVRAQHATLKDDESTAIIPQGLQSEIPPEPVVTTPPTIANIRQVARMSLPSGRFFEEQKRHHHHHEVDEGKEQYEYECKTQYVPLHFISYSLLIAMVS